ncbi:vacuolar protein sorting-associated protein 13A isoform X2 [Protopterus annectens]|uniref:vacuolar protein sorting-associated protein 13A isoform X2 n=1 Tax=Protopterus annectens TaxID=7888 RepID=UPI001CF94F40|nr:vacuolar protein sorting-associated protein 13A isoform X2 [Protopterus annectens]
MVFESVVVDVLNRFLGNYVVNLDSSQLNLGIWGGNVALKNLEIKENALSQLDVPYKVKAGHIGKLELKIPWKNIYVQPVEATLEGVYLLIVPAASIQYDAEKEEKYKQEARQRELQRIEDTKQKVAEREKPAVEKQDTFVEKLVTQVIKNLQVKISSIHIRYEDDVTNKNCPLGVGVSLQNLSLQTSDQNWNPCLHDETAKLFYKIVRLDNLFAYWNVNTVMYSHGSCEEALENLKYGVAAYNVIPENYEFVFRPISAKAKLRMNPRADTDFSSPKFNLEVNLEKIAMELNRPQYLSIMELVESYDMMSRNLPYRKYRPNVCVCDHAAEWWNYAVTGILEVNVKPRLHMWSWKHIRAHRQCVKKYKELYKTKMTTKKPSEAVVKAVEEHEKMLDIFNITLARQQGEVEAVKAGLKIYRPGVKDEEENSGWFGWMWGWSGGTQAKTQDAKPTGLGELMTPEEKTKLYAAIGYSETAADLTLPKSFEAVMLSVHLTSLSVTLKQEKEKTDIFELAVSGLSTKVIQRPGAQAIKFEAKLSAFDVKGLPQRKTTPCLLSSRNIQANDSDPLLHLLFETNPLDEPADQKLRVESQPLEMIYDARTVNSIADFFRPPEDVHLEQLTSATLMKLEEFRDKTSTGLLYVIETQKVLDLKINLMASYVLVPQNGFYDSSANLLVLDLGHLKMTSKSHSGLPQLTAGQSDIHEIMSRAYENFDVHLSSIQLLYSKSDEKWYEARKQRQSSLHILEPMDFNIEFSRALVVTDPRMPKFKVSGELPLLSVCISDEKLKGALSLLDSIPFPEKPAAQPPSSVRKGPQIQMSPPISTPQMTPRNIMELRNSMLSELDSEEEFYDAVTSPVEDLPYYEADTGSLPRSGSMRRPASKMREPLKNMTEFQLRFEIPEILLQICRRAKHLEVPVLQLEITGLGTELNLRTFDMTSETFLKEICLKCPEYTDDKGKPVYIITTLDNAEEDLLMLEYKKADRNGPEFQTTYRNTEQLIKINFSSLDIHLHTEALLSSMNFLNELVPASKEKASPEEPVITTEETKEETRAKKSSQKTKFDNVVNLRIFGELACLNVFIRDQKHLISEISIEGLDSEVVMRKDATEVSANLKNITVLDSDEKALYKKAVSITGKEVFSFKMTNFVDATEGIDYVDMNKVDSCVSLTVGCIQIIFVNKFIASILAFVNNFQTAKEALTEATVQAAEKAASGVKELAERSTRMSLDIYVKAPVVIMPQSAVSKNVLVADFGHITVKNEFSLVLRKTSTSLPPVIDVMNISLDELNLYRTTVEGGSLQKEIQLLQPVNLKVTVERNLAAAWYNEIPDFKISGSLKPMNVILSQEDLTVLLRTLNENLGDSSGAPTTPPAGTDQVASGSNDTGGSSTPQQPAGRTVVTAAVVETHTLTKVKTTLKLAFDFDSLSLVLYSASTTEKPPMEQRDEVLQLAEFKLGMISAAAKMRSDGCMNASVKLTNCLLDDKRKAVVKATPRMIDLKSGSEKNVMVDINYRQGRDGTVLDTVVQDIYLCASVEFLLTVLDVFVKANEQSSDAQRNNRQATAATPKQQAPAQQSSNMEMNVQVKNPEIVFVADLTRADAPALVLTTECELCIKNESNCQTMTAAVKNLQVKACPFLAENRKGNVTTVLQPCDLVFQSTQSPSSPQSMELFIKSLTIKVSPITINTVLTITSALTAPKETKEEESSHIPPNLWDEKDVKDLKLWFLEDSKDSLNQGRGFTPLVPTGETLHMSIEAIQVTLEAGVGHRTVPMLLAKSVFSGSVSNWSTLINLNCKLDLEVLHFNELLGVWEPLLEPLEDGNSDFRPWSLGIKMKKKARKAPEEQSANENLNIPDYKTVINIVSKDQLNVTVSKYGLVMLKNLGQAFAEAASKTAEDFKKDQSPFVVKNCLSLPAFITPSDAFSVIGIHSAQKKYEVNNEEVLNMDYLQTKTTSDPLAATNMLNSKLFYIALTPHDHSTADKIPLTKLGHYLYSVVHKDSGVKRAIVCQTETLEGSKVATLRSPLQIKNHFFVTLNVYDETDHLGAALPGQDFNVPLTSYRSRVCFAPANENTEGFQKSDSISYDEIIKIPGEVRQMKCQQVGSENQSFIINIVPQKDIFSSDIVDDGLDVPFILHLWPPVLLRNLLPYTVVYSLEENSNQNFTLEGGHHAELPAALIDHSRLELYLLHYLDHKWKGEYCIKHNEQDINFIKFTCVDEEESSELDIAVHVTNSTGQMVLGLLSPYWMVNKTGRLLQYKADDIHRKHPSDYDKPLLFSFKPKNFSQTNKVRLLVSDSELSDSFSLDTVGSHGNVRCKGKNREYQVGVKIDSTTFALTRIVTFTPFYMLENRTKHMLQVIEEGKEDWISIASQQCVPFWPEKDSNKLQVKLPDFQMPSKSVNFNKQENGTLLQLDNKYGGIIVDVNKAEHSTIITFSDYHDGVAPFLIINHTTVKAKYHQSSAKEPEHTLPPGKAVLYSWSDPTSAKIFNCKYGEKSIEIKHTEDKFDKFTVDNKDVYIASFLEGLQRILLFTEDAHMYNVACESEKAELAEQEIIISLAGVGISLVNNDIKQEISYIGISSSDIVWETKPKKKARWKTMSIRQTDLLEKAFRELNETGFAESTVVELDSNLQVCLSPNAADMKILHPHEAPIRRNYLPGVKLEYSVSAHQASYRIQIYRIQIQNQLNAAIFPYVFYPVKPPKSITVDSAPKPFTDVSVVTRSAGHSKISRIKYFMVLIQEMDLRIDLGFIYALMDIFAQGSTNVVSVEEEVDFFKKDVEYVQTELMTVSSTEVSQINFFEHFHISPIKLHLSFSLSTGGEDGNKQERDQELIPIQSLNLLLKSIGATLTDVQDVVFKLACFQIENHFYTTSQLQNEVVRHYSKQAIRQMYVLVLGLDVLGNPFGLFRDVSEGVGAFFYEPYQGAIQGPEEFVEGMALGVKALVGGAVGGLAGAASRITGAMAKGVAAITMDEEYQQKRREAMNKQPSGFREGVTRGGKGLVSGFVSGITGIVTQPVRGAQREGAAGFFKGVGKGLVGAVARPTGGIIDMASSTFQGIRSNKESM